MNARSLALIVAFISVPATSLADDLNWGGTWVADWNNFGIGPYTAIDTSNNPHQTIQIFCLDFNDSIAPPIAWTASMLALNEPNVAGTGAFAGSYAAQYGGSYNTLLQNAFNDNSNPRPATEKSPPQVSGASTGQVPPYAFNKDNVAGGYSVNLAPSNQTADPAYTRYLEAAWLFQDMLLALPGDVNTDIIAQVAAWELFVNSTNLSLLTNDVDTYGGRYIFNNYLALAPGQTYLTTSVVHTQPTGSAGITFEQAVDAALSAAQTAVVRDHWGPGSFNYGSWTLVTATPDYVIGYGDAVQEFLSPNAPASLALPLQNDPVVPEPKAVLLLGSAGAIVLWKYRRRRAVMPR